MIVTHTQQAREDAARVISAGGVIAFRTDTFYGLGADPLNARAVARIRKLKGRDESKPILVLVSDADQVERFIAKQSDLLTEVTKRFWPGPLTIVGIAREGLPAALTVETGTIGVRLPNDKDVRDLVRTCGGALTATSANPAGLLPSIDAKDVESYFADGVDLIIDDGEVTANKPSTVVDLSGSDPKLIREGAIPKEELDEVMHLNQ